MLNVQTERIKPILHECQPMAAVELLRILGWGTSRAHVNHTPGSPEPYARLILGSELTGAGTQSEAQEDLWWTGFQQGARYHLAVVDHSVRWYDFQKRQEWSAGVDDDLRPLLNLQPDRFVETGEFAPAADHNKSERLPGKPPREYLTDLVKDWYTRFLKWDESSRSSDRTQVQREFVRLVARLVFIRTIEDLGTCEWLRPDVLRGLANGGNTSNGLRDLFKLLKHNVNSQVFSSAGDILPTRDETTAELLRALYTTRDHSLNFAAIEFSMIGRFYERVLGDHHEVRDTSQMALIGPQERDVTPISHRRELGQYYTPAVFAEYLARKVVLPRVRAAREVSDLPRVADIACGSGEMLTASLHAMLSVPRFRTPESVRYILKNKLVGVDINPTATQLTALNLIRTALLLCPDVLKTAPSFPTVEGLDDLDALKPRMLSKIGHVDVIMTNPPFRGQPDWQGDSKPRGLMTSLSGQSNKATAFLLKATEAIGQDGTIGIVMPNQFFSSKGNRDARNKLLDRLNIVEIVDNQGARVFDGVNNQPGILIARVNPSHRTPNMMITCLAPSRIQAKAILSTGLDNSPGLKRLTAPLPSKNSSWLGESAAANNKTDRNSPTTMVGDLLLHKLIRTPIASIGPMGKIWEITQTSQHFRHPFSSISVPEYPSKFIRPAFSPKKAHYSSAHDPLIVPTCNSLTIFPYMEQNDGKYKPARLAEWRKADPALHRMLRSVCDASKRLPLANSNYETYRQSLEGGTPQFYRLNNLRPNMALLVFSRMASIQTDSEAWSSWVIPASMNVVPLSGLFGQSSDFETLQVIACLLRCRRVFEQLREVGSARSSGWVEVSPKIANMLIVPDIRHPALAARLAELKAAIASKARDQAEIRQSAEALWLP